jgi:hypothetical protein
MLTPAAQHNSIPAQLTGSPISENVRWKAYAGAHRAQCRKKKANAVANRCRWNIRWFVSLRSTFQLPRRRGRSVHSSVIVALARCWRRRRPAGRRRRYSPRVSVDLVLLKYGIPVYYPNPQSTIVRCLSFWSFFRFMYNIIWRGANGNLLAFQQSRY